MFNNVEALSILKRIEIGCRPKVAPKVTEVFWLPPEIDEIIANVDNSSLGNPGNGGAGLLFRNHACAFLGSLSRGTGLVFNYIVECYAIVFAMEIVIHRRWNNLGIETLLFE
ncbi:hypothetical protein FRX31_023965 [Thalictrum thalictroides]|uniref:Uncharacterized protein n=1 Tax=Thalictrum thalictroides TaxID=46969 RepID=A0A7J6VNY2_THATH|nr:hypothetical protein FRX31_023965 [Thalictrum thalictroides]